MAVDEATVRAAKEELARAQANLKSAEARLENALKPPRHWMEDREPRTERTVIRFSLRVKNTYGSRVYHYAGIKVGSFWYLTGGEQNRNITWEQLWRIINNAELIGGKSGLVVFPAREGVDE